VTPSPRDTGASAFPDYTFRLYTSIPSRAEMHTKVIDFEFRKETKLKSVVTDSSSF